MIPYGLARMHFSSLNMIRHRNIYWDTVHQHSPVCFTPAYDNQLKIQIGGDFQTRERKSFGKNAHNCGGCESTFQRGKSYILPTIATSCPLSS